MNEALFRLHSFPTLQDARVSRDSAGKNASTVFQPSYGCHHADAKPARNIRDGSAPKENCLDPAVAARGMSFENGYCEGSIKACDAVKKSLKPDLESFLSIFEDLAVFQSLVAETAAQRILELAFVIAELVMGTRSCVDLKSLEDLKNKLETDLHAAYQMELIFHPEDGQAIKQAFTHNHLQWPEHHAVRMRLDANQPRKDVAARMQATCFEHHALGLLAHCLE